MAVETQVQEPQAPHCRPGQGEPRRAQSPDRGGSQAAGGGWGPGPAADGERLPELPLHVIPPHT